MLCHECFPSQHPHLYSVYPKEPSQIIGKFQFSRSVKVESVTLFSGDHNSTFLYYYMLLPLGVGSGGICPPGETHRVW